MAAHRVDVGAELTHLLCECEFAFALPDHRSSAVPAKPPRSQRKKFLEPLWWSRVHSHAGQGLSLGSAAPRSAICSLCVVLLVVHRPLVTQHPCVAVWM